MRSLRERLAAGKPEPFIFKDEGDCISGEIEAIERQSGGYGEYDVLTILCDDDNEDAEPGTARTVAMFGGVLKNQMATKVPVVGMTVAIRYEGTKPSKVKGHQPYKDYWVLLDEATRPAGSKPPTATAPKLDEVEANEAELAGVGEEPF